MKYVLYFGLAAAILPSASLCAQERDAGLAGYYSDWFDGKRMANGELVNQDELTASIASYPFDTTLRVTSLETDKSVVVRVTDRPGPKASELIVVTRAAAEQLGFLDSGRTDVAIETLELGEGRQVEPADVEPSSRERRWKRGGLGAPGKKPSPFSYSEP